MSQKASFSMKLKDQKAGNQQSSSTIFGQDDDDDEEEQERAMPKYAKYSRNIGVNTPQAIAPKIYKRTWNVENAKHQRLSIPQSEILNDKVKKEQEMQAEKQKQIEKEQEGEEHKRKELRLIIDMIRQERDKVQVCKTCKRKFSTLKILNRHEETVLHRTKMLKTQQNQ